jgi:DNA polymerase gamma 1
MNSFLRESTLIVYVVKSTARINAIGVQQLPKHIYDQLFASEPAPPPEDLVELAKDHLDRHQLLGKISDKSPPIAFDLPPLEGASMDEHFYRLGMESSEPYMSIANEFAQADMPPQPKEWVQRAGWTKYNLDGTTEKVEHPGKEKMLVFDVEVLYKISPFAVMACAVSPTAWYAWISPWILGETESERQLIPLGTPDKEKIVVGHNIGYDRVRIKEEYNLKQTKTMFLDTMSLHVAVNGMCSRQRPTWMKHAKDKQIREQVSNDTDSPELASLLESGVMKAEEEEAWVSRSSINSLRDVALFHCDIKMDKSVRDKFGELDRKGVLAELQELLTYCASDVATTHKVYQSVLPRFFETCPHPVSFGALRHMASLVLPINKGWDKYVEDAEKKYQELSTGVTDALSQLAEKALENKDYETDDWLKQLDWSGQEIRYVKPKKEGEEPREAKNQKMPGKPKWYKALFPKALGPINLTVRTRVAPLLLHLMWDKRPLVWSDVHGWTFKVPNAEAAKYDGTPVVKVDMNEEKNLILRDDVSHTYFKLPHKNGAAARCASPLAKSYLQYFETGIMTSEYPLAKEALEMNAACSYWISARERIKSQTPVWQDDTDLGMESKENPLGIILPQIIPMGTITRRAVESTWLTASNAKKNRVGSELKAMITAPPGYVLVGADVDSEELWIASLVGDAQFQLHGGNAIGFMTLEGSKAAGTDLHSRTAGILGISRNHAKIFNYGRIYGAGIKFATTLLRQFNPSISDADAQKTAENLYLETKGQKEKARKALGLPRPFWRGGTESLVFNKLEEFADQDFPRTPVLGAGITEALMRGNISKGGFLTSRINWAIQSSGVDYLHLLIVSMEYLIKRYSLDARISITVHDEIRYLVKEEDKYRLALALQIANLWTRAMFCQQMGIDDVPQSCAWFSAVDIDRVLRKEVDVDCVTPSHPDPIPPGECLDIQQLLQKGEDARLDEATAFKADLKAKYPNYTPRVPVMKSLVANESRRKTLVYLRAQIAQNENEVNDALMEMRAVNGQLNAPPVRKAKPTSKDDEWFGDEGMHSFGEHVVLRPMPKLKAMTAAKAPARSIKRPAH